MTLVRIKGCISRLLFLLVLTLLLFTGCANNTASNQQDQSLNFPWGISLEQFNCPIDFPVDSDVIEIADSIMEGKLIVLYSMEERLEYDPADLSEFDWDVQYSNSPNTFQLYLQCLNPVAYLTKGYELTGNETYLLQAQAILDSWTIYMNCSPKDNPFLWYDHGTALRAETLIYYALVMEEAGKVDEAFVRQMDVLLNMHGEFLSDSQNYTRDHNHGIFQDRALIYISYVLNNDYSEEWLDTAKERLKEQYDYAFNSENVHVENSPGYAFGVMELFLDIGNFLAQFGDLYGEELSDSIYSCAEFMSWMIKPNGTTAEIGDTNSIPDYGVVHAKDLSQYKNEHLNYAASLGKTGEQPEWNSCIYPVSGYYFGRSDWDTESYSDSTWCMFKAGYSSKTHKHSDDCSFMLYSKGYDIFVDPGWYNYISGDRYRDYFISSRAHNTIIVDGKTYSPTVENSTKTGVLDSMLTNEYDYVLGFNSMYHNVEINRHFYYMGDAIVLFDDIVSEEEHEYSQLFQLSESMQILNNSDTEIVMSLADTGYIVRIKQVGEMSPSLDVISGTDETEYGHISRGMNLLDTTTTLKFNLQCSSGTFVTVVTIEDENGFIKLKQDGANDVLNQIKQGDIIYDSEEGKIQAGSTTLSLEPYEQFDVSDVEWKSDGDTLYVQNLTESRELSYAYYLIDKISAEVVLKSEYSSDSTFSCSVPRGEYLLKAYARSRSGQRKSAIVAEITNKSGSELTISDGVAYNLIYNGHQFEKISESTYKFSVDFDYSWNFNIKWYIYKNGGYYDSLNSSEKDLVYTFSEPGNYTVMYYLTTSNGDNEFWNFPILNFVSDN